MQQRIPRRENIEKMIRNMLGAIRVSIQESGCMFPVIIESMTLIDNFKIAEDYFRQVRVAHFGFTILNQINRVYQMNKYFTPVLTEHKKIITGTLPATVGYGIYEVVGFEPNTNCIHKFFMYSQTGVTRVFIRMFVNNQWYPWKEYKDSATILTEVSALLTNLRQERYHGAVAAGTDWDTLTAPGYYMIETLDGLHAPGISGLYAYGLLVVETAHIQELATVVQTYYPHVNNTRYPITSCIRKGHDKTRWQSWEYTYDATTTQLSTSIAARNGAKINTSASSSSAFRSGNFLIVNFDVTFTDMGTASEAVKFRIGGIPTGLKSVRVSGWCSVNSTTEVLMAGMSNVGDWTLYKNYGAGRYAGYAIGLY